MPYPANRRRMGAYVARLRKQKGLTQLEVSRRLGYNYYTYVSQIETGQGSVPAKRIKEFAKILDADPVEFAWEWLRHYQPFVWRILSKSK